MARWQGTTTQRGLGAPHVRDKKRLKALLRDGEPCWRCGQPMYSWQDLDRDHIIDRARGGTQGPAVLAHASCNRSAGARLGNKMYPQRQRTGRLPGRDTICRTCGKVYSRAPRSCEICGQHYHPNYGKQRTCGRTCGAELQRLNRRGQRTPFPATARRITRPVRQSLPACEICSKPCHTRDKRTCSHACSWQLRRQEGNFGPMALRKARMGQMTGEKTGEHAE
jgi:hypothetical protein